MGRIYTVNFQAVSISAAQDIFNLACPATSAICIHEINLTQKTLTSWEAKDITFRHFTATVTNGSGGGTATPRKHDDNGAAALSSCRINDTTVATTSGTATIKRADSWAFLNGFFYLPAPEDRIYLAPSQNFIVRLDTAPSGAMTASGSMTFEELV